MTSVYAGADGARRVLSAKGHATGSVQVCAAVSMLMYALAGYLCQAEEEGRAEVWGCRLDSGDAVLDWQGDELTAAAFDMAVGGLAMLAEKYPEFVRVEYGEA